MRRTTLAVLISLISVTGATGVSGGVPSQEHVFSGALALSDGRILHIAGGGGAADAGVATILDHDAGLGLQVIDNYELYCISVIETPSGHELRAIAEFIGFCGDFCATWVRIRDNGPAADTIGMTAASSTNCSVPNVTFHSAAGDVAVVP